MTTKKRRVHWLLYPFWLIWRLATWIIEVAFRLVGAVLGLVLMVAGVVLTLTIIGAIIGIPMAIIGVKLIIRSLF